jgi:uncharacterized protein YggE
MALAAGCGWHVHHSIGKIMRTAPWLVAVALCAGAFLDIRAQTPATPVAATPQVVTTGEGEARIAPDRATIYLGVQTRSATAATAAAENARRQRAILDTLRAVGLSADLLSTINYSVTPEMQYDRPAGTPRVTGYTVNNTVRAEIRRLDDVARVIDAALAKGANQISSLEFYSSNADEARRSALAMAVAKARGDADAIARAAGGTLGALLEVTTNFSPVRPFEVSMRSAAVGQVAAPTPIEPGQQTVQATVTTRWQFVPGR